MSYPTADPHCYNEPEHTAEPGYSGLTASITGPVALCLLPQINLFCENETFSMAKLPWNWKNNFLLKDGCDEKLSGRDQNAKVQKSK